MINCYVLNGEFYEKERKFEDFHEISTYLKKNLGELHEFPVQVIILIINIYSKKIASNREILRMEGVPFLCFSLKRTNMEKQLKLNFGNMEYLNNFVEVEEEKYH